MKEICFWFNMVIITSVLFALTVMGLKELTGSIIVSLIVLVSVIGATGIAAIIAGANND